MRGGRYSPEEVKALVEGYAELREQKGTSRAGLRILVLLADIDRAIRQMPPKEYHTVLLHGLLGWHVDEAEVPLGVSRATLYRRYSSGVQWITDYLNGENDEHAH